MHRVDDVLRPQHSVFLLSLLHAVCSPLQGALNLCLFLRNPTVRRALQLRMQGAAGGGGGGTPLMLDVEGLEGSRPRSSSSWHDCWLASPTPAASGKPRILAQGWREQMLTVEERALQATEQLQHRRAAAGFLEARGRVSVWVGGRLSLIHI